jgi:predicted ATPase
VSSVFIKSLRLDGFLSFAPGSEAVELQALNVLIGPNASGKSNVIEAIELLHSTPTNFADAIRDGGGASEWLWKGREPTRPASVEVLVPNQFTTGRFMRYRLDFDSVNQRTMIVDEALEEENKLPGRTDVFFFYRFNHGRPKVSIKNSKEQGSKVRTLQIETLRPDQSVLAQRKDPELYPELTRLGQHFSNIQMFREWSFGRYASLRQPQRTDADESILSRNADNLALIINQIEYSEKKTRFEDLLKRFFPRFEGINTRISGGTVQFYLKETGFGRLIPPTRLSDGTIRFIAILATLLTPNPPPLVCIEEPEMGLHPDAMTLIAELLVEASERMQIIVTTHSDSLVSALTNHAQSVLTCERLQGATKISRLQPEQLAGWLDKYLLGDLWKMGELGANP